MKSAREIIYQNFIKPFEEKNSGNIGVELEFPLVNNNGKNVDVAFLSSMMEHFEKDGFSCVLYGVGGEKLFMENSFGDTLSFDNSYNNFEFSMMYGDNLCKIENRFKEYYEKVQSYLKKEDHTLKGRGINPNFHNIDVNHTPFSTYNMVEKYLHKFPGKHQYNDFPAFISSVQTHLDINKELIAPLYTLFSRLGFVRALLFGNSPDFENRGWRIFRDYLWEKSGFGNCPNITGTVDCDFQSTDEVVDFFLEKGMFNRIRGGKYEVFSPVKIRQYFDNPIYNAKEEDIECYLSFCNVEITKRGTLEIRSDCTQENGRFFMPPAFNLGILNNCDEAKARLDCFIADNKIEKAPSELRALAAECRENVIASKDELSKLCIDMLELSREGLKKRDKGEEKFLA